MLRRKEKGMIKQSNNYKRLKQLGAKIEPKDWILSMKKYKKNIMLSRRLIT